MRLLMALSTMFLLAACEGPKGPTGNGGPTGATGVVGPVGSPGPMGNPGLAADAGASGLNGDAGVDGCPGLSAGQTEGLLASLQLSQPMNGQFFVAGEQLVATIRFTNRCGQTLRASDLTSAGLYMYGPRGVFATTSASLLNCIVDRNAPDKQHHFINLGAPKFLDTTQANLATAADGTITFTFAPVSSEVAGTYTVGVLASNNADADQLFQLADLQIGTATVESYADGATAASTCFDCHRTPGDNLAQMHHSRPSSRSAVGEWSLDEFPTASCKSCHNVAGYSPNPIVHKVHGLHRGQDQTNPGVAHPEYGLLADATLASYTDVLFPSMPGAEKDCAKCHTDDRWQRLPSRLACGTCHDNLFFNTGVFTPPRTFGTPAAGKCALDSDCATFGRYAVCDTGSGTCVHSVHPIQNDDAECVVCHNEGATALAPISAAHEIYSTTRVPGLKITSAALSGSSAGALFVPGDIPAITFSLVDKSGAAVNDLSPVPNPNPYSATAIISGPSSDRQRLIGPITISLTAASFVANGNGGYTYTFPSPLPLLAQSPYNTLTPGVVNPTGSYTAWLYVNKALTLNGQSFRDVANAVVDFGFKINPGDAAPIIKPRQVVTTAACNSCHVDIQAHGGGRKDIAEQCSNCHTEFAVDRGTDVPATGNQCIVGTTVCPQYQSCVPTPAGTAAPKAPNNGYCIFTTDPTPNNPIDFTKMIHKIHFARLLGGYAESTFLPPYTGTLVFAAFGNNITDESQVLFSEDIRNCVKCHADAGNGCSTDDQCGVGQTCANKLCVNNAWLNPSARACITCHDTDYATGHAALNTWSSPNGPVETCNTCHSSGADFAVATVHSIRNPYVPTYQRTP